MFKNSNKFWSWIVVSSADPSAVALTVKGFVTLGTVQAVFSVLPYLGFHPNFDLNGIGDTLYTVVYGGLTAVSGIMAAYGAIRKFYFAFVGKA